LVVPGCALEGIPVWQAVVVRSANRVVERRRWAMSESIDDITLSRRHGRS
jgi:hypothetical protein